MATKPSGPKVRAKEKAAKDEWKKAREKARKAEEDSYNSVHNKWKQRADSYIRGLLEDEDSNLIGKKKK